MSSVTWMGGSSPGRRRGWPQLTPAERTEAWAAAADRAGGHAVLEAWLRTADIDPAWARRLVDEDLIRRRFVEFRFRDLAFVSEAEVTAAMGAGQHGEATREAVRTRLEADAGAASSANGSPRLGRAASSAAWSPRARESRIPGRPRERR